MNFSFRNVRGPLAALIALMRRSTAAEVYVPRIAASPDEGGNQHAIRRNQTQSDAISCTCHGSPPHLRRNQTQLDSIRLNQTQSDSIRRNSKQSGVRATDRRHRSDPTFPQPTPDEGGNQHAIKNATSPPTRSFHSPHSSFSCSLRSVTDEPSITFVSAWMAVEGVKQWPSEVIRGHQRPSEVIRGHQRSSEAIRGHRRSSEVIRGHQSTCGRPDEV
jgi:hypothetical protein